MKDTKTLIALKVLLADSYTLMLKVQNYHWNIVGHNFYELHAGFEAQYENLFAAVDIIAERIRMLGDFVPATYKNFESLSSVDSEDVSAKNADMVASAIKDHKKVVASCKKLIEAAQDDKDDATIDIAIERIQAHDKFIWMLESSLK